MKRIILIWASIYFAAGVARAQSELSVTITGVDEERHTEHANPQIVAEEFIESRLYPLLPYVFYSENSSELPSRYRKLTHDEANTFLPEDLRGMSPIDVYHQQLNIIGRRLKDNPASLIRIAGYAGKDTSSNVNRARAATVRHYLQEVWHIDTSRTMIEQGILPTKESNASIDDGAEDNSRAEIASIDTTILSQ